MKRIVALLSAAVLLSATAWAETEDVVLLHQEQTVVLKRPQVRNSDPMDAVLIVQNHVSDEFQKPLVNLGDQLSTALTGDLFNVIDPNDVIGDDQSRGPWGENMPLSSATRLAENLDAQVLLTAAVGEASVVGQGAPARVQAARMKLTLSAKRLPKGANVASVTVTETSRMMTPEALEQNADSVYSELVDRLVEKAAAEFLAKCERVSWHEVALNTIEVAFGCNFPGADVSIDGISYGTAGTIGEPPLHVKVSDGLHNLKISYPYTHPFEVRAKFQEGTTFMVVLRETDEGRRVRKEDAHFDALMDRIEKSGATDDAVRMIRARGYGRYLSSSYTRIQGMPQVLSIRDCPPPDLGLNPARENDGVDTSTANLFEQAGAAASGNKGKEEVQVPEAAPAADREEEVPAEAPAPRREPVQAVPVVQEVAPAPRTAAAAPVVSTAGSIPPPPASPAPPSFTDALHDVREGVDTSKDIIQGIKDIGDLLK